MAQVNGPRWEPAVYAYVANGAVAAVVAFWVPLSTVQTRAVTVIATAVLAGVAAVLTRPADVSALVGAGAVIAAAGAAFGLHLSQAQIGAGYAFASVVLALVLRQAVSPVPPAPAPAPQGARP